MINYVQLESGEAMKQIVTVIREIDTDGMFCGDGCPHIVNVFCVLFNGAELDWGYVDLLPKYERCAECLEATGDLK